MTMAAARHGTIGPMAFLGIDEKMRNFASVSADLDVASVRFDMIFRRMFHFVQQDYVCSENLSQYRLQ